MTIAYADSLSQKLDAIRACYRYEAEPPWALERWSQVAAGTFIRTGPG